MSAAVLLLVGALAYLGMGRVWSFTQGVESLKEKRSAGIPAPRVFDARYDIWFDADDAGLRTYQVIEDQFIAEDTVLLAFSEDEHPWGVFSPKALATIARLTKAIEQVKFVRQVRSLTRTPWVRWSTGGAEEEGVVVTDLFERDPTTYSEDEVLERMIAALGAKRASDLVGKERVVRFLGSEAAFADHIGEPRLLGRLISEDGRAAALQIQVVREKVDPAALSRAFGDSEQGTLIGSSMHANESQWEALADIERLAKEEPSKYRFRLAGMPELEKSLLEIGLSDLKWIAVMFVVLALVLSIVFRSFSGVAIPLGVVTLVVVGMLSAVLAKGDLLNNLTAIAPNMVLGMTIGDSVFLISSYYLRRPYHTDRRELMIDVISSTAMPIFLTSSTTAVGFFSLMTSEILTVRMLGYTTGIGAIVSYLVAMTFVPTCLSLLPMKARGAKTEAAAETETKTEAETKKHWADWYVPWVMNHRWPISIAAAVLTILAVFGITRVELTTDLPRMFPPGHDIRVDTLWIDAHIGGTADLEIVFAAPGSPEAPDAVAKRQGRMEELAVQEHQARARGESLPDTAARELASLRQLEATYQRSRIGVAEEFLAEVDRFEKRLKALSHDASSPLRIVSSVESPLDVLRKMNQVNHTNATTHYRVPGPEDVPEAARTPVIDVDPVTEVVSVVPAQTPSSLASQYYLQYENGARPEENLSKVLSADRRIFRMSVAIDQAPSRDQYDAFVATQTLLRTEFPLLSGVAVAGKEPLATTTLSGKAYLFAQMFQRFVHTMTSSLFTSVLAMMLLIVVVFRSFSLGLISSVANVMPVMLPVAAMGFLGIQIDGPAALTMSVALGVAVDDTIHFFTKFKLARSEGKTVEQSLLYTVRHVGGSITSTTVILMCGFAVMMMSDFRANAMIGYLGCFMVVLGWAVEFVVTPALLSVRYGNDSVSAPRK